jgi:hypothetical protein
MNADEWMISVFVIHLIMDVLDNAVRLEALSGSVVSWPKNKWIYAMIFLGYG